MHVVLFFSAFFRKICEQAFNILEEIIKNFNQAVIAVC